MEVWGLPEGKWKRKWKSEKWKFLIQGNYSKKACSCEQAFLVVCGKVANNLKFKVVCFDKFCLKNI